MNDRTIVGAAVVSTVIVGANSLVTGRDVVRPLVGIAGAAFLLALVSAAGAGQVAAPLAVLAAGTIVLVYIEPVLSALGGL